MVRTCSSQIPSEHTSRECGDAREEREMPRRSMQYQSRATFTRAQAQRPRGGSLEGARDTVATRPRCGCDIVKGDPTSEAAHEKRNPRLAVPSCHRRQSTEQHPN